ncbi:MAG: aldose 1-epimerase family protein [Clostridia bacterium]|nr:aldose 1-epimerase family protein [Clostridia bacterium]
MASTTISNNCLVVTVSDKGAELKSIKSADGREYLWQGDPEFWNRRSPVLFPFVGAVVDDKYTYQGKVYSSKQHGFARDKRFVMDAKADTSLSYTLTSDEETKEIYPFDFALTIGYTIHNNVLTVSWTVKNTGNETMYYSIGGHPAFNLPEDCEREDCFIMLDKTPRKMTAITDRYADGEVDVKDHVKVLPGHLIALDKDLFAKDALVFENDQVHMVALCDETRKPFVEVAYDAPVIGIWSPYKEGCSFVCIEPWYGRCDSIDFKGTLEERAWGNSLAAGEEKKYSYTITIL